MNHVVTPKSAEIERNLARFIELLPSLLLQHKGKYVLMRDGEVVGYHSSAIDAQIAGNRKYQDRLFSIQHVEEMAEELGYYSYAVRQRIP